MHLFDVISCNVTRVLDLFCVPRLENVQYPYHLYISPSNRPSIKGPARPFQCPTCGVRFTRIQNLKQHMLIHSGEDAAMLQLYCLHPIVCSSLGVVSLYNMSVRFAEVTLWSSNDHPTSPLDSPQDV